MLRGCYSAPRRWHKKGAIWDFSQQGDKHCHHETLNKTWNPTETFKRKRCTMFTPKSPWHTPKTSTVVCLELDLGHLNQKQEDSILTLFAEGGEGAVSQDTLWCHSQQTPLVCALLCQGQQGLQEFSVEKYKMLFPWHTSELQLLHHTALPASSTTCTKINPYYESQGEE